MTGNLALALSRARVVVECVWKVDREMKMLAEEK